MALRGALWNADRSGFRALGVDIDDNMISYAKAHSAEQDAGADFSVEFSRQDATCLSQEVR